MNNKSWFEIDRKGLAQILARKGKEFAIFELVQNAWDEEGVKEVQVGLMPHTVIPGYCALIVRDDAPNGFRNLTDAYTLFAPSKKKANPEQRGRFNLGEKLVLALCREAKVMTTSGTVVFGEGGRSRSGSRTMVGSMIEAVFTMTKGEIQDAVLACRRLLPPDGILTTVNGLAIDRPRKLFSFPAALLTEIENKEGHLVKSTRNTVVEVYGIDEAHPASIYEMGIPVCEIEGKYSFNVMQKIPLTMDREEVLPQFRKQLAVASLNALANHIDTEDANTGWATEAVTSPDIEKPAMDAYMTQRFGEKRVIYDPSDAEANSLAAASGYTVITGSQLNKAAWANVKAHGSALPAGQVTPSPKPYSDDGDELPRAKITAEMTRVEHYAKQMAKEIMGVNILVVFAAKLDWPYSATYGPSKHLVFNVARLGKAFFDLDGNQERIDNLLIHEFGHEYSLNHLSEEYYDALTSLGAKLAKAIREGRLN